jgi:putative adhesin
VSAFWDAWRKEIIRGTVLFCAVLSLGLFVHYAIGRAREGVTNRLPVALRELRDNLDPELNGGPRAAGDTWTYRAKLTPHQWVWIHNTNGSVTVEPAKGDSLEVTAVKSYRHSNPASVRLVAAPYDGGVAICAAWSGRDDRCEPGEDFKLGMARRNDVAVEFTVHVPRRIRLGVITVNGGVHVTGATAPVVAKTVSGDVDAETAAGPVRAVSVNGSVRARIRGFADSGEVSLTTVNGSVTAELPARLDADMDASTVNGSINTDYPLTVTGKFVSHELHGSLGRGGRPVRITTVNGSINLKKAI